MVTRFFEFACLNGAFFMCQGFVCMGKYNGEMFLLLRLLSAFRGSKLSEWLPTHEHGIYGYPYLILLSGSSF